MNDLVQLIGMLNKEEARSLKIFLNRTQSTGDRKDIRLFDEIRKSYPAYDEEKALKKLYGKAVSKNALYRLKNRLLTDINKSLSLQYYDQEDYNVIIHNLLLARLFLSKSAHKISYKYLVKAERKALASENYQLLDLIYNDFVKLSQEALIIDPEDYIEKRQNNRKKLRQIQEMDDILALLIYRIKSSQNFGKKDQQVSALLEKIVSEFGDSVEVYNSPQLKFRVYHAVSRLLLQQNNFEALEKYLLETYQEFTARNLFNRNNHDTKLQMLTYLTNALFKNNKLTDSLQYAERLHDAMLEYGKLLFDKYLFYYYNALVINYSEIDKRKAIQILLEAQEHKTIQKLPVYNIFINLNLAVLYFDTEKYKDALKRIVKLKMEDSFKGLDPGFQLKIQIVELMIRFELDDFDFLEYLTDKIKKDYSDTLADKSYKRDKQFCEIVLALTDVHSDNKEQIAEKVSAFLRSEEKESAGSTDILNYAHWLRSHSENLLGQ